MNASVTSSQLECILIDETQICMCIVVIHCCESETLVIVLFDTMTSLSLTPLVISHVTMSRAVLHVQHIQIMNRKLQLLSRHLLSQKLTRTRRDSAIVEESGTAEQKKKASARFRGYITCLIRREERQDIYI
jgi:hypothetical protein